MMESKYNKKDTETRTEYNFAEMKASIRALIKKTGVTDEEIKGEI